MIAPADSRRRFLLASSRLGIGAALLATLPSLQARSAAAPRRSTSAVSLAFDPASQTLFKANADALYRSADDGRHWSPIELPAAPAMHLKAVAVSAGSAPALYVAGQGVSAYCAATTPGGAGRDAAAACRVPTWRP